MIETLILLAIAVYTALAALRIALHLLEITCDFVAGLYWHSTRRFAADVLKHLVMLVLLLKLLEYVAPLAHLHLW